MQVHQVPIASLRASPYNPNYMSKEQFQGLVASVKRFRWLEPVVVNRRTTGQGWSSKDRGEVIVGGHNRVRAAKELGEKKVPVVYVELPETQEQLLNLALNNHGQYDVEKLGQVLKQISAAKEGLQATGMHQAAIRAAIQKAERAIAQAGGEPEIPELPERAITKPGEILELGRHRVLCADSTAEGSVVQVLGVEKAALFLSDPPYAIYGSSSGLSSDITDDKIVRPFFEKVLLLAKEHTQRSAHAYVFCDWRSWASWWEMAKRARMLCLNLLMWDKGGAGLGNNYANAYELIGFFGNVTVSGVMTRGQKKGTRAVLKPNILRHPRVPSRDRKHNAAKPVSLLRELILNSTDEGDLVIDPFLGSGSTLLACEQTARRCVGLEIDPRWCDVTRIRYEAIAPTPTKTREAS